MTGDTQRVSSLAKWLVPDVALVAAAVTFFYSVFLFPGYRKFFSDSDAGWHIRAGELMVARRALPNTEPFSFTMNSSHWYAWEWGADVIVGTIHKKWGLSGVVFFYATAIALGVWLWFRLNWLVEGNFFLACLFAAPMISTTTLHWLARPHVLSWLFLLGSMILAERIRRNPGLSTVQYAAIAAASCVWANVHGSFFFGSLIALIYAAGIVAGHFVWKTPAGLASVRTYLLVAAISFLASFANPFGWNLHTHVFSYLSDSELLSRVNEYQTFNFHTGGAFQVLVVVGLAALGGVVAIARKDLAFFFLAAFLIAAGIHSARGLPIVALLLLPLANGAITKQLAHVPDLRPRVRAGLAEFLSYSDRLRVLDARSGGWLVAPALLLLFLGLLRTPAIAARTGFPPADFPVAASNAIDSLPQNARILAPDKFGGYLIYRFDGRRKVFFDGRSDLYGAAFLKECARLLQARPGWQAIMEPYRFDAALLPDGYPLISALEQAGWKPLYHDTVCTLLTRN